jgi:hypothetical protein
MVRKEIAMHLLAYNLIRQIMAEAAASSELSPGAISFKGALQTLGAFRDRGLLIDRYNLDQHATLLAAIAAHTVGDRPNRVEPRAVKRRPSQHFLTVPRHEARKRLLKAT